VKPAGTGDSQTVCLSGDQVAGSEVEHAVLVAEGGSSDSGAPQFGAAKDEQDVLAQIDAGPGSTTWCGLARGAMDAALMDLHKLRLRRQYRVMSDEIQLQINVPEALQAGAYANGAAVRSNG
jgi:hypothetical protein